MPHTASKWTRLSSDPYVATLEYSFGPATATSLAVDTGDGLLVVSPPARAPLSAFEEIASLGRVRALVAPNAFHHLGLPAWSMHFPDAAIFAPAQSIARLSQKSEIAGIRPLSELGPSTGDHVLLTDMPHYKTGEALVRIRTADGMVWYVTDVIMNMAILPPNPIVRMVFAISRSGPGLRLNRIAPLFMVRDRAAL